MFPGLPQPRVVRLRYVRTLHEAYPEHEPANFISNPHRDRNLGSYVDQEAVTLLDLLHETARKLVRTRISDVIIPLSHVYVYAILLKM